jgi:putative DNA methylase
MRIIRSEAQAGRLGERLMAVVAEGERGRVYLSPQDEMEATARSVPSGWKPDLKVTTPCHDVDRLPMYGMPTWGDAFTKRQLLALTTFSDLLQEVCTRVTRDAASSGLTDDGIGLDAGVGLC